MNFDIHYPASQGREAAWDTVQDYYGK